MSLRFKGSDLRPVLAEAVANQCRVVLAKDQGVYFLAEQGARRPDGRVKLLAYAVGCNPDTDPFNDWWELAHAELGEIGRATSELQSLMRISYAVFCLKKKKTSTTTSVTL